MENPLLPAGYDLFWSFALIAPLLLIAAAVVVFRADLATGNKVVLTLLAVALPVLGPMAAMILARFVTPVAHEPDPRR